MGLGVHEELTRAIIGCAFRVQNTLGCGFLEKVYENALAFELEQKNLKVQRQVPLRVHYEGVLVGEYVADIVVGRAVLVEIKAVEKNAGIHEAQVLNYLKATGLTVGLLLNFGRPRLHYRRLTLRHDGREAQ